VLIHLGGDGDTCHRQDHHPSLDFTAYMKVVHSDLPPPLLPWRLVFHKSLDEFLDTFIDIFIEVLRIDLSCNVSAPDFPLRSAIHENHDQRAFRDLIYIDTSRARQQTKPVVLNVEVAMSRHIVSDDKIRVLGVARKAIRLELSIQTVVNATL